MLGSIKILKDEDSKKKIYEVVHERKYQRET